MNYDKSWKDFQNLKNKHQTEWENWLDGKLIVIYAPTERVFCKKLKTEYNLLPEEILEIGAGCFIRKDDATDFKIKSDEFIERKRILVKAYPEEALLDALWELEWCCGLTDLDEVATYLAMDTKELLGILEKNDLWKKVLNRYWEEYEEYNGN